MTTLALAGSLLVLALQLPASAPPEELDALVRAEMEARGIPGLALAVARKGELVLARSYGLAELEPRLEVTADTPFMLNSITKAVTGVALAQLAEDGKLELDEAVGVYLDDLPEAWMPVTLRQLATHQSGLPDVIDGDARLLVEGDLARSLELARTLPLEGEPGRHFRYSGLNYLLLGRVIEGAAGMPFDEFFRKRQFEPAGVASFAFGDADARPPGAARVYALSGEGERSWTVHEERFPPALRTAAGLYASASDLARWALALQSSKLLARAESRAELWTPGRTEDGRHEGFGTFLNGYGLGWPLVVRAEHRLALAIGGGRSALAVYPDDGLVVVVLTNLRGASPELFIERIAALCEPALAGH